MDPDTAQSNYIKATHKGLLKIISKMGISTIHSYCGAQIFEAVGLGRDLVDTYFTWTPSRIGGIGIGEIEKDSVRRHASAYHDKRVAGSQEMDAGGQYQWRNDGERHMWDPDSITKVQHAVSSGDAASFQDFTDYVDSQSSRLCTIRGALGVCLEHGSLQHHPYDVPRLDRSGFLSVHDGARWCFDRYPAQQTLVVRDVGDENALGGEGGVRASVLDYGVDGSTLLWCGSREVKMQMPVLDG